jgi:hypothetical protein
VNDELLAVIEDLKCLVTDGPDLVDIYATVYHSKPLPCTSPIGLHERLLLRDAVYRHAHVEHLGDWLPVGTPKDWVLGELDRLSAFVTGDDI